MEPKIEDYISDILEEDDIHIQKLNAIVAEAIKEEELIIAKLANPPEDFVKKGDRISDKVASFGGSWKFINIFLVILVIWIIFNSILASRAFDPYPFILLNLILSCIAALQAPVIMMSQNRKEEKDRKRAENDYLINLKAEIEIRNLHQKIDLLLTQQMKSLFNIQKLQVDELNKLHKKVDCIIEKNK